VLGAQGISRLGDIIFSLGSMWIVLTTDSSPLKMAIIPLLNGLLGTLLSIPGGTLADRIPRKLALVVTDAVRGIILVGAGMAVAILGAHSIPLWAWYGANAVVTAGSAVFGPALSAMVPDIVGEGNTPTANGFLQSLSQGIGLLGNGIAGWLVALVNAGTVFAADGLSFLLSSCSMVFLRSTAAPVRSRPPARKPFEWITEGLAGVRYVLRRPHLRAFVVVVNSVNFLGGPVALFAPLLSARVLGTGAGGFGALEAAGAAGAIIGGLSVGTLAERLSNWRTFGWLLSVIGAGFVAIILVHRLSFALAIQILQNIALVWLDIPIASRVQTASSDEIRARVMAALSALLSGLSGPLGIVAGGVLLDVLSVKLVYIVVGALLAAMGIVTVLLGASAITLAVQDDEPLSAVPVPTGPPERVRAPDT
jgi:DHA3 family macrolide efflux protein-like MFS transporter